MFHFHSPEARSGQTNTYDLCKVSKRYGRFCTPAGPAQHATFSRPTSSESSLPKISPCFPRSRWMAFGFGLRRAKVLGYLSVQLVSKISNLLCGPRHWQTDVHTGKWLRKNLGFLGYFKNLKNLKSPKFRF